MFGDSFFLLPSRDYLVDLVRFEAGYELQGLTLQEFRKRAKRTIDGDLSELGSPWFVRWIVGFFAVGLIERFFYSLEADEMRREAEVGNSSR